MMSEGRTVVPRAGKVVEIMVNSRVGPLRDNDGAPRSFRPDMCPCESVEVAHKRRVLSGGSGQPFHAPKNERAEGAVDLGAGVYDICPLGAVLLESHLVLLEKIEERRKGEVTAVIKEGGPVIKSEVAALKQRMIVLVFGPFVVLRGLVLDVIEVGAVIRQVGVVLGGKDLVLAREGLDKLRFGDGQDSFGRSATLTVVASASAATITQNGITKSEGVIGVSSRGVALHAVRLGLFLLSHLPFPAALSLRIASRISSSAISAAVFGSMSASISFSSIVSWWARRLDLELLSLTTPQSDDLAVAFETGLVLLKDRVVDAGSALAVEVGPLGKGGVIEVELYPSASLCLRSWYHLPSRTISGSGLRETVSSLTTHSQ